MRHYHINILPHLPGQKNEHFDLTHNSFCSFSVGGLYIMTCINSILRIMIRWHISVNTAALFTRVKRNWKCTNTLTGESCHAKRYRIIVMPTFWHFCFPNISVTQNEGIQGWMHHTCVSSFWYDNDFFAFSRTLGKFTGEMLVWTETSIAGWCKGNNCMKASKNILVDHLWPIAMCDLCFLYLNCYIF